MMTKITDDKGGRYWRLNVALVLNALLILLILLRDTRQFHFDLVSWIYMISVSLGYYVLAVYVIASLSYFILSPFKRLAIAVSGAIIVVVVYYLLIDSYAFSIIKMHIDLFWLKWVVSDFGAFGLSPATLRSALLALVALIAVEVGIFALAKRVRKRRYVIMAIWVLLPLLYVISQVTHVLAYETNDVRITGLTPQLPFYMPITSHSHAAQYANVLPIGEDELSSQSGDYKGMLCYPLDTIICDEKDISQHPNIVILFFESWRYDMMNDSVTPHVYSLAQKSTVCLNHLCSGNSTVAGIFGFFYGLCPTYWPAVKANNAIIHNPVLIDVLMKRNYAFGIYAKSNFQRHKIKDAVFRDIPIHEDFIGKTKIEQDSDMNRQLISFLHQQKRLGKPFMAMAFYKSNHAPYEYPPEDTVFRPAADKNLMDTGDDADATEYLNDYRNSTRYVDSLVGDVLKELDSLGFMANTIVIISTDHGEEFNDNKAGYWGHGSNYTQYQTRVPLIFYAPGRESRQLTRPTGHIDVVPTLLEEFLGCRNAIGDYSNGQNLFKNISGVRSFVVGSYVSHAFIMGDNVYEINPYSVKDYKEYNIKEKASSPSRDVLSEIANEMGRFLKRN